MTAPPDPERTPSPSRRLPGPAVAIALVAFCAAVLVFVGYRRQAAIEASGPLLAVVPFTEDDAVAVRGAVPGQPGGFLLRLHRARGMAWTTELDELPESASGLRVSPDRRDVLVAGETGWRGYRVSDGSETGLRDAPSPAPTREPTDADRRAVGPGRRIVAVARGDTGGALLLVAADDAPPGDDGATPATLAFLPEGDDAFAWRRRARSSFSLVAFEGDLYAQSGRGLLVRVAADTGRIEAAARAPGGADAGYPLARHQLVGDRLWLHDDLVMVTLDRNTLRTLVGLDRIRAVPVLETIDDELPPE